MTYFDQAAVAMAGEAGAVFGRAQLQAEVGAFSRRLREEGVRVLATLFDNSPAWIVVDLAAELAGVVHVPLPAFFTPGQVQHALSTAGVDAVLVAGALAARWAPAPARAHALAGAIAVADPVPRPACATASGD